MVRRFKIKLPPLGMRIIKTALSLLIALILWDLVFARFFPDVSAASICVFAMLAVQDTVRGTWKFAFERMLGNLLGIIIGFLFMQLYLWIAGFDIFILSKISFYLLVAAGVLLCLYLCKALNRISVSIITLLVFINLMFAAMSTDPIISLGITVLQTFLGILIAMCVNLLIAPPKKDADSSASVNELGVYTKADSIAKLDDVSTINDYDLDEVVCKDKQVQSMQEQNALRDPATAANAIAPAMDEAAAVDFNADAAINAAGVDACAEGPANTVEDAGKAVMQIDEDCNDLTISDCEKASITGQE